MIASKRPRGDEGSMTMLRPCAIPPSSLGATRRRGSVKNLSLWLLVCFSIVSSSFVPPLHARQDSKIERKLVTRVEPDYPPVLRMRQIGGTVRLEVTISPKGNVENAKVLGGNPILVESAVAAVKKWKYASAATSTTTTVSLDFNPYR
ncbi:MAG TPA: energy transducer TonB [Candidatus Acidoferrales bacterium]|nr:energy transducer TonB [Candidatus Acidoferrales bacterium]